MGEWSILLILNPFLRISALIKVIHAPKTTKNGLGLSEMDSGTQPQTVGLRNNVGVGIEPV